MITLYLLPRLNVKLIPQLEKLKPGSRIVSHDFDMEGVKPDQEIEMTSEEDGESHTLYLWTVPLKKEKPRRKQPKRRPKRSRQKPDGIPQRPHPLPLSRSKRARGDGLTSGPLTDHINIHYPTRRIDTMQRRDFVKSLATAGAGMMILPSGARAGKNAPGNKLNVALIGVWGRGLAHYDSLADENVVALCRSPSHAKPDQR